MFFNPISVVLGTVATVIGATVVAPAIAGAITGSIVKKGLNAIVDSDIDLNNYGSEVSTQVSQRLSTIVSDIFPPTMVGEEVLISEEIYVSDRDMDDTDWFLSEMKEWKAKGDFISEWHDFVVSYIGDTEDVYHGYALDILYENNKYKEDIMKRNEYLGKSV